MRLATFLLPALLFAHAGGCSFSCGVPSARREAPAGSYTTFAASVGWNGQQDSVEVARVSPAFFEGPQVRPMIGRLFVPDEYRSGTTSPVALISYDYWQSRFGGSPEVVGRQIDVDGRRTVIVGVTPQDFAFPQNTRISIPQVQ